VSELDVLGLGYLVVAGVVMLCTGLLFWKVFEKAGYPGPLGQLVAVPVLGVLAVLFLALSDWPVRKQLRELQERGALPPSPTGK